MNIRYAIIGAAILLLAMGCNKTSSTPAPPTAGNQAQTATMLPTPSKPTLSFLTGAQPFVQINWNNEIASEFNVYRATTATGPWTRIISHFPNNAGAAVDSAYPNNATMLYYRIAVVSLTGEEGVPSEVASVSIAK